MYKFKLALALVVLVGSAGLANAQFNGKEDDRGSIPSGEKKTYLTVQGGYSFGALVRTYDADVTLEGSEWFGGALDYAFRRDILFEISYMFRTANMTAQYYSGFNPGTSSALGTVDEHYIQLGTLKTFRKGKVAPFIGGQLGVGIFAPERSTYSSNTFFTVSGLGGANIFINESLGIRLQGRLLLPIFFGSVGFYCGGGCGVGVGGTGTIEGEMSGGLFLNI